MTGRIAKSPIVNPQSAIARLMVAVGFGLVSLSSCDRSDHRAGPLESDGGVPVATTPAQVVALSPTETVRRVHQLRAAGKIGQLEAYLVPDQRASIVELIQSMDQLLSANRALQASVREHLGPATAAAFDRSEAANAIGVFSEDIEILSERIEGDRAIVTIQVADRVPLTEVRLVRRDGRWQIQTDPPIPEVAEQLCKLADVLVQAARRLEQTPMTAAELERELDRQQAPIGRRLAELTDRPP